MEKKKRGPKPMKELDKKVQLQVCIKKRHLKAYAIKALALAKEFNEK